MLLEPDMPADAGADIGAGQPGKAGAMGIAGAGRLLLLEFIGNDGVFGMDGRSPEARYRPIMVASLQSGPLPRALALYDDGIPLPQPSRRSLLDQPVAYFLRRCTQFT